MDFNLREAWNQTLINPEVEVYQRKQPWLATIHKKLGHLSYTKIKLPCRAGLLPKELASIEPLTCPGCAYGKAKQKPWGRKGIQNQRRIEKANALVQVISCDQVISPTPGLVPTHRGSPTTTWYVRATIFVDHWSDFTYVYLMTKLTGVSTVAAKQAFEQILKKHGVKALHYHANNGLFDTKVFCKSIAHNGQTLTFCGVNAHHQNSIAECCIQDVTTGTQTSLLHASHRWLKAIHPSLWPAAMKYYVNVRSSLPTSFMSGAKRGGGHDTSTYESSLLSKLSNTEV